MDEPKDTEGALLRVVRQALSDTSGVHGTSLDIYTATGVTPSQQWAIKTGKTKAPSVNTIERLYDYFAGGQSLAAAIEAQQAVVSALAVAQARSRYAAASAEFQANQKA